jgi:hypothetical protein
MQYGLILFETDEETIFENLLLTLSSYQPSATKIPGYTVSVADSLKGALDYIGDEKSAAGLFTASLITRVYASYVYERPAVLIAADTMEGRARWITERWRSKTGRNYNGMILSSYPKGIDWDLIGIATPGWVLLFDEEMDYAAKDIIDDSLRVAYLPGAQTLTERLQPDVPSPDALVMLLDVLLDSLPWKTEQS